MIRTVWLHRDSKSYFMRKILADITHRETLDKHMLVYPSDLKHTFFVKEKKKN